MAWDVARLCVDEAARTAWLAGAKMMRRADGHAVTRRHINALKVAVRGPYRGADLYALCLGMKGAVVA